MVKDVKRYHRHNKSVSQLIILAIQSYKCPSTSKMIQNLLEQAKIPVKKTYLKKVLKKLVKDKILKKSKGKFHSKSKRSSKSKTRYALTGKMTKAAVKSREKVKRLRKSRTKRHHQKADAIQQKNAKLRRYFRKLARKMLQKGKTLQYIIYKYLSKKEGSKKRRKTFNQIQAYLRSKDIIMTNNALDKVLVQMREKRVIRLRNGKNSHVRGALVKK